MSTLRILAAGLRATVQDRGRFGHLRDAVPSSGPADLLSFEIAQRLVGNTADDAAIEIVGLPFRFSLNASRVVAVAGRDARLRTRVTIPGGTAALVRAAEEAVVEGSDRTRFAYLAVSGGIGVTPVLGSRSSYVAAGIGHPPLATGDDLPLGPARAGPERAGWAAPPFEHPGRVRATAGPHIDRFSAAARRALFAAPFRVTERSDRMGTRLAGPPLERAPGEILSVGVVAGAVQVPSAAEEIVLLADHQTTGGYPVIAVVVAADLGIVAQVAPGEELSFLEVDADAAVRGLRERRRWLGALG